MVSLRQLKYFMSTADTGQISAAARSLRISQSSITVAIKELQNELGVKLIERSGNGIRLTAAGKEFVVHARNIEASVTEAIHSVKYTGAGASGKLSLGLSYTVAGYFFFPLLARFRRAHPGISLELTEGDATALSKHLTNDTLDMAISIMSQFFDKDKLRFTRLYRAQRRLWLSSDHKLLTSPKITLSDVAREPIAMLTEDKVEQITLSYWEKAGYKPNIVYRTSSLEAVRSIVATGAAVSILSDIAYRPWSLQGERIEARRIHYPIPTMDIVMVWNRARGLSEQGKLLKGFLESAL